MSAPNAKTFRSWYATAKKTQSASAQWYRTRGLEFERALFHLLDSAGLRPRSSYRPHGEQIDGSFVLAGRVYLLEAKWHKNPLPVSAIYAFQGKLEGNLVGTIGIFLSMSGFAPKAADALVKGKPINVILMDQTDIDLCMENKLGIDEIVEAKLRVAAEQGVIYWPSTSIVATAKAIKKRALVVKQ